jgi:hypothetical protein
MDQNPHNRRPHSYRGRRPDRRGPDRRPSPQAQQQQPPQQDRGGRGSTDVEQIMRDLRSRIAQRHGIDLSQQQIQELAARRLEAILDPRTVKPALLDELRRSAKAEADATPPADTAGYDFTETTIYESHRGIVRFLRRLLNPLLMLFVNPNPIARALSAQTTINAEAAARAAEQERRLTEWNALLYDIVQRLVTEVARSSIEVQALTARVESLSARVDFNDKRVRSIEAVPPVARPAPRQMEERRPAEGQPPAAAAQVVTPITNGTPEQGDGSRRRRRRRRGRRPGWTEGIPGAAAGAGAAQAAGDTGPEAGFDADAGPDDEGDEPGDDVTESIGETADDEAATSQTPAAGPGGVVDVAAEQGPAAAGEDAGTPAPLVAEEASRVPAPPTSPPTASPPAEPPPVVSVEPPAAPAVTRAPEVPEVTDPPAPVEPPIADR